MSRSVVSCFRVAIETISLLEFKDPENATLQKPFALINSSHTVCAMGGGLRRNNEPDSISLSAFRPLPLSAFQRLLSISKLWHSFYTRSLLGRDLKIVRNLTTPRNASIHLVSFDIVLDTSRPLLHPRVIFHDSVFPR